MNEWLNESLNKPNQRCDLWPNWFTAILHNHNTILHVSWDTKPGYIKQYLYPTGVCVT